MSARDSAAGSPPANSGASSEVLTDELTQPPTPDAEADSDAEQGRDAESDAAEPKPKPKPKPKDESDRLLEEMVAEIAAGRYDQAKTYVEKAVRARADSVAKEKEARKAKRRRTARATEPVPPPEISPSSPPAEEQLDDTPIETKQDEPAPTTEALLSAGLEPPAPEPPALSVPSFMLDPSFDPTPPMSEPGQAEEPSPIPPAASSQPGNVTFVQMPVVEFGSDGLPFLRGEGAPPSQSPRAQSGAGLPFKPKAELTDDTFVDARTTPVPPPFVDEPSTLPPGTRQPALPFPDEPETLPVGTRAPALPFVGKSNRASGAQPVDVDRLAGTPFRGVTPWTEKITMDQYAWLCSIELSGTFDVGDACATLSIQRSDLRELHEVWRSWIAADRERASQFEAVLSRFTRKL